MKLKKIIKWFICGLLFLAFLTIMLFVIIKNDLTIDSNVYSFMKANIINDKLTPFVKVLTQFCGEITITCFTIVLFIIAMFKNKKLALAIALNIIVSVILNNVIKFIISRPRPLEENRLIHASGYSFPSGHAMNGIVFYGFLVYLIYKMIKNKPLKYSLIILINILVFLVGLSRIYLGVHYTSDVIAGYLFGFAYLIISISLLRKFNVIKGEIKNETTN